MSPIFCNNADLKTVVDKIQDYLAKGCTIKGIRLVEISDKQVVLLVDDQPITQSRADDWWDGYNKALEELGLSK